MATWRHERVAEMIHREVVQRLRLDLKDPELEPISVTRVEVTRDLGRATVYYLPFAGGEATSTLRAALSRAGRTLRGPLGRALRLRTAPEIVFAQDVHQEAVMQVDALLQEIARANRTSADEGTEE